MNTLGTHIDMANITMLRSLSNLDWKTKYRIDYIIIMKVFFQFLLKSDSVAEF